MGSITVTFESTTYTVPYQPETVDGIVSNSQEVEKIKKSLTEISGKKAFNGEALLQIDEGSGKVFQITFSKFADRAQELLKLAPIADATTSTTGATHPVSPSAQFHLLIGQVKSAGEFEDGIAAAMKPFAESISIADDAQKKRWTDNLGTPIPVPMKGDSLLADEAYVEEIKTTYLQNPVGKKPGQKMSVGEEMGSRFALVADCIEIANNPARLAKFRDAIKKEFGVEINIDAVSRSPGYSNKSQLSTAKFEILKLLLRFGYKRLYGIKIDEGKMDAIAHDQIALYLNTINFHEYAKHSKKT